MSEISSTSTLKELKLHPYYKQISGRSSMNKEALYQALSTIIKSNKTNKSKATILTTMPKEIYQKVLMDMAPQTLINACVTDKRALQICTNDDFWRDYYNLRGLKFKRYNYPYLNRITEVRTQLLHAMNFEELQTAIQSDKLSLKICNTDNFWNKYRQDRGIYNFHRQYKGCDARIKEFKIGQWVDKMGAGYGTRLKAKICGDHIDDFITIIKKFKVDIRKLVINDCINVIVEILQPDEFLFYFYKKIRSDGLKLQLNFDFLYQIYDLMSDKK